MAEKRWIEDVLDGLQSYFEDYLNNKLTVIENERTVTVPRAKEIVQGDTRSLRLPKVEIHPDRTDHDYGFPDKPLVNPWLIHYIDIWIEYSNADLEKLRLALERYDEAINRLVEDDSTFGGLVVDVSIGTVEYTPLVEDQKTKKAIQALAVPLELKTR